MVGGLKLDEPAADLTVALSLVSSLKDQAVYDRVIAFGEVGLAGEIRAVGHAAARISEAARLGFTRIVLPRHNLKNLECAVPEGVELLGVRTIRQAFDAVVG